MSDLSIYLSPVELIKSSPGKIGEHIQLHDEHGFPEFRKPGVAIIYVPEYRNSNSLDPGVNDTFRNHFYSLNIGEGWDFELYDLGTILPGERIEDTYFALSKVIETCVKRDVIPFIVGGSQDLVVACYKGYEHLEQMINICAIDKQLDVGDPEEQFHSEGFVSHLLLQRPCYLFNYAVVGIQRPYVTSREMDLFGNLYFDVCRLGSFNDDFKRAEPHLRNSDLITVDFTSVKSSDSDVNAYDSPNGFRADQICKVMHYAGISDKLTSVGVFNLNSNQSDNASRLVAEMVWYFVDGYNQRVGDFPVGSKTNYKKFYVHLEDFEDDLVFYKSNRSERWWLEVKYPSGKDKLYSRHQLVPCNSEDYDAALKNNIPDLWWRTLQKLST